MGFLLNGVETGGVPIEFIKILMQAHKIPNFVETGTGGGSSVIEAAKIFKQVHSIEISKERSDAAKDNIRNSFPTNAKLDIKHVHLYIGDSTNILPDIISEELDGNYTFFWLDAHYCDSVVSKEGEIECPVMNELDMVADYSKAIIMIDDARMYLGRVPWPNDPRKWPTISQIFEKLKINFPDHFSTIIDDYVLCVPPAFREAVNEEWRARFSIRYPSAEYKLKTQVKDVYNAFKNYIK